MSSIWFSLTYIVPLFLLGWWFQQRSKNAGWVDVLWAFATGVTGVFVGLNGDGETAVGVVIAAIYALWFGRLGWHLLRRIHGHPEEGRYVHMRVWAGNRAGLAFLLFYLMQASWVWLFALPGWVVSQGAMPPLWALDLGLFIVLVAWVGESLADRQLAVFRNDPANKGLTCREGLWRYSRHPNYFFEWLHWFAYPLLGWNAPGGQWLWLAPAVVFIFLYYVTGIPFTEQQALRTRGEDYRRYQQTTSLFIPWRPKT
jgi:steroid 5-alpha reductase family enzyme